MSEQLTAQQRAAYFNAATRVNEHMLPKQIATEPLTTLNFTFPKSRLLSKVHMAVKAKMKVKGTAGTVSNLSALFPYRILSRVSVDLNNGFSPYVASGEEIALLNLVGVRGEMVLPDASGKTLCKAPAMTASTDGTDYECSFMLELPLTLNDRDTAGLVLLQNQETTVSLTVDIANPSVMLPSGYTATLTSVEVMPCLQTYTIPAVDVAFPDLSVVKLVTSKTETYPGAGENIVKLNVGTIYRKLILNIKKSDGTPVDDVDITSNIQLMFNQADSPYNIAPQMLRYKNISELGFVLPKGVYVFDFSYAGFSNYAGSRDYIDTERLQEFWIKFNTTDAGKITVVSENISRLV